MNLTYRILSMLAFAVILLSACSQEPGTTNPVTQATDDNAGHYIVILKSGAAGSVQSSASVRNTVLSFINTRGISANSVTHVYTNVAKGFSAQLTAGQLTELNKDQDVAYVEKDQTAFLVEPFEGQDESASSKNSILVQTTPWGITAVGGAVNYTGSNVAWIVDTGIDLDHPDLNVGTSRCTTFVSSGQDARSADDLNGHGSHVSGIIAAKNNSVGVVGVAAGATVIAVKVLNRNGSGQYSDVIAGLDYVYANAADGDVVNLSLGGPASTSLDAAVSQFSGSGVYVTIAAGNDYRNAGNYSPSRVNGTGIYTISAYGSTGAFATFSNYGNPPVDYSAPGVNINSTYKNASYKSLSGTSMAAPHVAGILLATGGTISNGGTVTGDPDGTADTKAVR